MSNDTYGWLNASINNIERAIRLDNCREKNDRTGEVKNMLISAKQNIDTALCIIDSRSHNPVSNKGE